MKSPVILAQVLAHIERVNCFKYAEVLDWDILYFLITTLFVVTRGLLNISM